jgi:hypothetical protein
MLVNYDDKGLSPELTDWFVRSVCDPSVAFADPALGIDCACWFSALSASSDRSTGRAAAVLARFGTFHLQLCPAVANAVRTLAGEQMRRNVGFAHDTLGQFVSALESMRDNLEGRRHERVGGGEPVYR